MIGPGRRLRGLLEEGRVLVAPGAYDAITARMVQAASFDAVYMTGAGTVNAHLGIPDIDLAPVSDMADNVRRMAAAVDIPLLADADTGYGNALAVMRTVQAYEHAGAGGLHLEDQLAPKRCGHLEGKQLVDVEEMVGKIEAARSACTDPDFVIVARTDARSVEGFDAALARARQYVEAGADAIFPEALADEGEFRRFAEAGLGVPLVANMTEFGKSPLLPASALERLGYAAVIFPMTAFRVMLRAVGDAYELLHDAGSQVAMLDRMRTRDELYALLEYDAWEDAEAQYVRGRTVVRRTGEAKP